MPRHLPLVTSVIAAPCDVPWASMAGDDRKRHCAECKRDVHNLSAMTEAEIAAFLEAAAALPANVHAPCVSLFQRADGTVLTADCPIGLRRRRRRAILTSTLPFGAAAIVALTALGGVLGMYQHATAKLEDEPVAATAPTVFVPPSVNTESAYYGVVDPPKPSVERDVPEGRHVAGGIRAMPPPPPVKPPPPARRKVVVKKPTREPTSSEVLSALTPEPNGL